MIKKLLSTPLFWIFILALLLRTVRLSSFPPGFHVDEVKAGWNAYSLLITGRDDWLHPFPLHYDTFGDQRPTGLFYLLAPSLSVFGLTVFAVRFLPALFGALAVIAVFFLVREFKIDGPGSRIGTLAALLLALSPWHISLSRATSEGIVSTTLTLFGLIFLIRSLRLKSMKLLLLSGVFLIPSYFFYHTSRLLIPVFSVLILFWHLLNRNKSGLFLPAFVMTAVLFMITGIFILSPAARGRISQVSVANDPGIRFELDRLPFEEGQNRVLIARAFHNKLVVFTSRFMEEYARYFSADFFLSPQTAKPARYQTASRGLVLYVELLVFFIGLISLSKNRNRILPLILLIAAPLPAAVTTEDAPNLHRALLMSPFFSMIGAMGLNYFFSVKKVLGIIILVLLGLDLFFYGHMYTIHNSQRDTITLSRNVGADTLINKLTGLKQTYSRIYLTNRPDNLYPWYAFLTRQDPRTFNHLISENKNLDVGIDGITFSQYRCPSEIVARFPKSGILAVDAEGCPSPSGLHQVDKIQRSNGGTPYSFWSR